MNPFIVYREIVEKLGSNPIDKNILLLVLYGVIAGVKNILEREKSSGSFPVVNVFLILVEKRTLLKIVQLADSLLLICLHLNFK